MDLKEHMEHTARLIARLRELEKALAYRAPPIMPQDFTVPARKPISDSGAYRLLQSA
jgi:hypothetical protein